MPPIFFYSTILFEFLNKLAKETQYVYNIKFGGEVVGSCVYLFKNENHNARKKKEKRKKEERERN